MGSIRETFNDAASTPPFPTGRTPTTMPVLPVLARLARVAALGIVGLLALWPGTATAQNGPVVVELFTSQGCSACPPADAMIGELAGREDVIALALHVDYWDYIGWADTFAQPAFTQRQQGYARAAGSTVVYTPQMVVGGIDRVVGVRPMELIDAIRRHAAAAQPIEVAVTALPDGRFRIAASAVPGAAPGAVDLHLVRYSPNEAVEIARGENAGRHGDHYNVVRSWAVVAEWDGTGRFETEITPDQTDTPHVVLFQRPGHGAILAAARLD